MDILTGMREIMAVDHRSPWMSYFYSDPSHGIISTDGHRLYAYAGLPLPAGWYESDLAIPVSHIDKKLPLDRIFGGLAFDGVSVDTGKTYTDDNGREYSPLLLRGLYVSDEYSVDTAYFTHAFDWCSLGGRNVALQWSGANECLYMVNGVLKVALKPARRGNNDYT